MWCKLLSGKRRATSVDVTPLKMWQVGRRTNVSRILRLFPFNSYNAQVKKRYSAVSTHEEPGMARIPKLKVQSLGSRDAVELLSQKWRITVLHLLTSGSLRNRQLRQRRSKYRLKY